MLTIISLPIGNNQDITLRALKSLQSADFILTEEWGIGDYWRKKSESNAELILFNEHNAHQNLEEIIGLIQKHTVALISDCGTPVFADPGQSLLAKIFYPTNAPQKLVTAAPGASSLMNILSVCPFPCEQFYFVGFLPRQPEQRQKTLQKAMFLQCPLVILDTPYRMLAVLKDILTIFPEKTLFFLGKELTTAQEQFFYSSLKDIKKLLTSNNQNNKFTQKGRWIMVLNTPPKNRSNKPKRKPSA